MKYFDWNDKKNSLLRVQRNIDFEQVQLAVEEGRLLDNFDHPNQTKYPYQKIMVVEINDYAYLVPYIKENEEKVFLKSIIPSRKATKKYLRSK